MPAPSASTFVPRNERERLMALFADTVYEQGYALTRLSDVARRAGLDPEDVLCHWSSEEACAIDVLDTCAEQTFSRVAEAFMSTPGDCPLAAHRSLAALLDHVAGMPAMLRLAVIDLPDLNDRARRQTKRHIDLFAEFLGPGFAALDVPPPDPPTVSLVIGGGVFGVLRQYALDRRIEQLPAALPAISYVCVSTFFGTAEARRVLRLAELAAEADALD